MSFQYINNLGSKYILKILKKSFYFKKNNFQTVIKIKTYLLT